MRLSKNRVTGVFCGRYQLCSNADLHASAADAERKSALTFINQQSSLASLISKIDET